jgi:pimeloyl-ACP methyl ester carboxylesterase
LHYTFTSGSHELAAILARPENPKGRRLPGLVISHGYPSATAGAGATKSAYQALADRIATDLGWVVLAVNYRGCGGSEGNFSMDGWYDDTTAAIDELCGMDDVAAIWLAGFGTGGALAIAAAASDERVRGVAAMGPPADFDDWVSNPKLLLQHSRKIGVVTDEEFPPSFDDWAESLGRYKAVEFATRMQTKPFLLLHGGDDEAVPVFDARVIADAHGSANLRVVQGASHALRYDPRAVAILLGWLERQRHRSVL